MKKYFVCLANSKKYTQRCIAGVELVKTQAGFEVLKKNEEPVWIRPVSGGEHGEVPSNLVDHIKLLDIVEVDITGPSPSGYQSENVLFKERKLKIIRQVNNVEKAIQLLSTKRTHPIFGNKGKAVSVEHIEHLDHSLVLINPSKVEFNLSKSQKGTVQIRARFTYHKINYDLPVTDIDFIEEYTKNSDILKDYQNVHLSISLGVEFKGWHYKLVAGVIYF